MVAKTFAKQIKAIKKIEYANDLALKDLSDLRTAVEKLDPKQIMDRYNSLISHVYDMTWNYQSLTDFGTSYLYLEKLEEVEAETGEQLENFCRELRFGKKPKIDFESLVEHLNYDEETDGIDATDDCITLHDLVRCLHASTIESLFCGENLIKKPIFQDYGADKFKMVLADNGKNKDLLEAILRLYKEEIPKQGEEEYKIVVLEEGISARINMGCHFSNVDVNLRGNSGELMVKFINTPIKEYPNAAHRAEYVGEIMKKIGLEIDSKEQIIRGQKLCKKRSELCSDLEQCIKMLASTKDLDMADSKIKDNVKEAVDAFFKGTLNIYTFLKQL